jgi:hypothetical protein
MDAGIWQAPVPQAPMPHVGAALAVPFVMAPAPPLMRRWTDPLQEGQELSSGSDIFCRRSKCPPQSRHWYSYAGMGRLLACFNYTNAQEGDSG